MTAHQTAVSRSPNRVLRTAIKVVITVALLALLVRGTDLGAMGSAASNISGFTMVMSVVVLLALSFVQTSRWQAILRALGTRMGYLSLWATVLIGFFFSQLLPTSIGGDVARVWKLRQAGTSVARAFNSVLLDRLTALIAAALITALGFSMLTGMFPAVAARSIVAFALGGIIIGFLVLLALRAPATAGPLQTLLGKRLGGWLAGVLVDTSAVLLDPRTLSVTTALSCLIHVAVSTVVWMIARDIGADLSLLTCIVLVPLVILASMLPVSIAGWGVREGAMIVALGSVGVERATALTTSVAFGLALAVTGIPGGLIWLYGRRHPVRAS